MLLPSIAALNELEVSTSHVPLELKVSCGAKIKLATARAGKAQRQNVTYLRADENFLSKKETSKQVMRTSKNN